MTNPPRTSDPTPSTGAVLLAGRVVAIDSNGVSSCAVLTTPLPHGTELYTRSDAQDEDTFVIARLGELLARIAIAIKGPEKCLRLHSYHDLPELVEALVAASTPQPQPEQAGSVPLEEWEVLSMRFLAADLRKRGDDLSSDAASWLEKLSAAPSPKGGLPS